MWLAFVFTTLGWTFDGLDQMIYSMAVPWIMKDWSLTTVELGLIGSMFVAGHCAGNIVSSVAADYIGRKPLLWVSSIVYSIFTASVGFAKGVNSLGIVRALSGLGVGGQHTIAIAFLGENVPARSRGRFMSFMNTGTPLGLLLGIVLTSTVGIHYRSAGYGEWGWKLCFIVSAFLRFICALCIIRWLKESRMWLRSKTKKRTEGKKHFPILDLFKKNQIRNSLTCIILYTGSLMSYWGIAIWAPTYLATERGLGVKNMTVFMVFWVLGAWVGQASAGLFMDRFGRKPVLTFYLSGVGILSLFYGWITDPTVLFWIGPLVGFFVLGCSGPLGAYATELFPTSMRATGIGLAGGIGRFFAIITPTLVGVIAVRFGIGAGFYLFFGVMFITTTSFLMLGPETKGAQLN